MEYMQYSKFAVDESPFAEWEWDLHERNLAYINSIDPTYFEYIANVHFLRLGEDSEKQHAALSLRTAYSHGLETLIALIFATVQAPDCVIGWLHKYELNHLRSLSQKARGWQPVLNKLGISPFNWETITNTILAPLVLEDKEKERRVKDHFATAWARFSHDFIDEKGSLEYNSIKHGFRVRVGGFSLAIGREDTPGVPAPPERMRLLGSSEFGTSFYAPERVGEDRFNIRLRRHSRNWNPENFAYGLILISFSLQNVLSFLRVVNGVDPTTVQFAWPQDDSLFEKPWEVSTSITNMSMDVVILPEHIGPFNREEILASYGTENGSDSNTQRQAE